jgi:hypothetical protein
MNSYKTLKDSSATDRWFRSQGLNAQKCVNPDLETKFILAKRAAHCLLQEYGLLLDEAQLRQVQAFNLKQTQATARQIFGILNLYKKIRRQAHKKIQAKHRQQ